MATFITVTQEGSELLRRNQQQTQANRLAKVEGDERLRTEQEAREQRQAALQQQGTDASGNALVGDQRRARFLRDEPAAAPVPLRDFAFVDAYETYLTYLEGISVDPLYNPTTLIPVATANLRNYRVIRVMIQNRGGACLTDNPELSISFFFGNREAQFADYVRSGGVLWINTEFPSCGHPSAVFDEFLATVFGSSMFTDSTLYSANEEYIDVPFVNFVQKYQLAYGALAGFAPPLFYTEVTTLVKGGTPLYANSLGYCPIAFERIGNGYLVLSGDSDGSTQHPSYSANGATVIDALLQLRRLRP